MLKDPKIGYKVVATITGVKGKCNTGHQKGDTFEISCHNPGGRVDSSIMISFPIYPPSSLEEISLGGKAT